MVLLQGIFIERYAIKYKLHIISQRHLIVPHCLLVSIILPNTFISIMRKGEKTLKQVPTYPFTFIKFLYTWYLCGNAIHGLSRILSVTSIFKTLNTNILINRKIGCHRISSIQQPFPLCTHNGNSFIFKYYLIYCYEWNKTHVVR